MQNLVLQKLVLQKFLWIVIEVNKIKIFFQATTTTIAYTA